jgi:hypothetical protein
LCVLQWLSSSGAGTAMKQFVAMSDDEFYRAEGPPGPLVPYQCGVFCWHQLREDAREDAMVPPLPNRMPATAANSGSDGLALSA